MKKLKKTLDDISSIPHVELIRIGSRITVVNPFRIDDELLKIFENSLNHKPIYFMHHFNHPKELTRESSQALLKLSRVGVVQMNQFVLLNGINNHPAIIQALARRLLFLRVKPYYMFQCDPSEGNRALSHKYRACHKNSKRTLGKALWPCHVFFIFRHSKRWRKNNLGS